MNDPIESAVIWWRATAVKLNPPADDEGLAALERFVGAPFSGELRRFYRLANGMVDLESDEHEVSFWSIERVLSENDTRAGVDDGGEYRDIAFCRLPDRLVAILSPPAPERGTLGACRGGRACGKVAERILQALPFQPLPVPRVVTCLRPRQASVC